MLYNILIIIKYHQPLRVMEFMILKRLFEDKEIVNPINPEEVFTCKDLVDGNYTIHIC
jgi:hypothetical protein